jgi:hypothetical protein
MLLDVSGYVRTQATHALKQLMLLKRQLRGYLGHPLQMLHCLFQDVSTLALEKHALKKGSPQQYTEIESERHTHTGSHLNHLFAEGLCLEGALSVAP